jgi:hypothetical protein
VVEQIQRCQTCGGSGCIRDEDGDPQACEDCNGS